MQHLRERSMKRPQMGAENVFTGDEDGFETLLQCITTWTKCVLFYQNVH